MNSRTVGIAILALCVFGAVSANEFHHKDVVDLTASTFEDKVNDGGVWFIKFYAPWCGHCKRLAGDWGNLASSFKDDPKINVAHVDCTVHREVCSKFEVRGYPTLKAIVNGAEFKAYKGARDLASLKTFLADTAKDALSESS